MKTRIVQAMDVPIFGVFIWQNDLYTVLGHKDNDDTSVSVKIVCRSWTQNPYDRVLYGDYSEERFNGYCEVAEVLSFE
jgi:hypothetical protein